MQDEAERLLKALYDTLPDPVVVVGTDRHIQRINPAAERSFGYSRTELIGMSSRDLYVSHEEWDDVGRQVLSPDAGERTLNSQVRFRRKDGSVFEGALTLSRITDATGKAVGLLAIVHDLTDVLAAQTERLRTETILQEALSSISQGFVIFDAQDRLVQCNQAYRNMYALSAPAIVAGATFESILRYGAAHGQYVLSAAGPGAEEAWIAERMAQHRDPKANFIQKLGDGRWIQIDERITPDNHRVGVRTDITSIVKVKAETDALGRILEFARHEIYVFDASTLRYSLVNRGARANLQYDLEELVAMTPLSIMADVDAAAFDNRLAPLIDGSKAFVEFRALHRRKYGTLYPCTVQLELLDLAFGRSYVAFVEDITWKVEIEAELEERRRNFETLVSNLPDAISRARPDMTLTYVNDVYAQLVGMTPEAMIGRRYVELVPPERRQAALGNIKALTKETPISTFEQVMVDMDGQEHVILWSDLMIYDDDMPTEIVSVGRDITERHAGRSRIAQQSRELALRNEALEQFTGIVSHDLKAPLRHVRQFADMIREDAASGQLDELPLLTAQMQASVGRMERMIAGLLEYSKFAYKVIHPVRFTVSQAIDAARENLTPVIAETGATLEVEAGRSMTGDFELIVEMLQNLMANALKYRHADRAPQIRIAESVMDDRLEIRIEDNGIGIAAGQAESIFGVFHRLHRDETTYAGAGIGLALCRKVAESHGGSIRLDTSYSGGCRFVVSLPAGSA